MNATATAIVRRLRAAGHTAYFAGGCVRDMLRGVEPHDIDIATTATPAQVQALFPRTVAVGAQFGVIIVLENDHQFEVATFRNDDAYIDGRRPSAVRYGTPEEDARRRDFTINGLFYDPLTRPADGAGGFVGRDACRSGIAPPAATPVTNGAIPRNDTGHRALQSAGWGEGQVIDFVNGRADIEQRIVRSIGNAEHRFGEDKLRLLRCVRFASNLDFAIEPATFAAVKAMAPQINIVSAERIREELIKIFTRPNAGRGLELLDESGLLREVLPEVAAMKGVEQPPEFHPEGDVFQHVKLMLDVLPANPGIVLAFAVLLHDIGKPPTFVVADRIRFNDHDKVGATMTETLLRRLRFSNDEIEQIVTCVGEHMRVRNVQEMRPAKLKRILARPTFPAELELHRLDCIASHGDIGNYEFLRVKATELPPEVVKPAPLVTGHDLLALGLKQGPVVGQILKEVAELQLDDRFESRAAALAYAQSRVAALTRADPT